MDFSRTLPRLLVSLAMAYTTPSLAARHATQATFPQQWALKNTGQHNCNFRGSACTDGQAGVDIKYELVTNQYGDCSSIIVAVLDTGADLSHPDLKANLLPGKNFVGGNESDDPQDDNLHGTHVSGIIAGSGTERSGVVGVCHKAQLLPVKVASAEGQLTDADILTGINYAVAQGARVVNGSFGGPGSNQVIADAIGAAPNTLFVFAAGNGDDNGVGFSIDDQPSFPAAYDEPNIVAVAATDSDDNLGSFSNFGAQHVHLAAPGVNIVSSLPMKPTAEMSQYKIPTQVGPLDGTSMATPYVTGALTMLIASNPGMSAQDAKAQLLAGVDQVAALDGKVATGGRLNLAKMMGVPQ
jgi:subtilisin family serine protease